jgi:hypothetical protein
MSIRRCPACRNLVERDSVECPICGRSYTRALIGRIVRWGLLLAAVGLIVYWLVFKRG